MPTNGTRSAPSMRWVLSWLACLLVLAGLSGSALPAAAGPPVPVEDPPPVIESPPEAFHAPNIGDVRHASSSVEFKIESSLNEQLDTLPISSWNVQDMQPDVQPMQQESRVQTQIVLDASALQAVTEAIEQAGGEVTGASLDETRIQAWLPVTVVRQIADLPAVHMIRRPDQALLLEQTLGTGSTTEALNAMNAPAWHASGQIGAGVKVGVIDTGFMGYAALLGTDLPAIVTTRNFVDGESPGQVDGTTQHGTACAEIVYDVAPGVQLYLAKVSTNFDLQEAVQWLESESVDIISTSLTWYNVTPGDGTGEFADLVQDARNHGILWVTAAGNDREDHWGGPYTDANGDGFHEFNGNWVNCFGPENSLGDCYPIPANETLRVFLRWDDWTQVTQDFDLYLVRYNGSTWDIIGSSTDAQEGRPGQRPTEYASGVTYGTATAYGFYIRRFDSSRTVNFELFAPKSRGLIVRLPARSLGNLADAPKAITVAAVDVFDPYPQETYSS
jgi:hypothetical protein